MQGASALCRLLLGRPDLAVHQQQPRSPRQQQQQQRMECRWPPLLGHLLQLLPSGVGRDL
jgi:hypothetical protein